MDVKNFILYTFLKLVDDIYSYIVQEFQIT